MSVPDQARIRAYWRANLRLMGWLLAIWLVVSLSCSVLFIEQPDRLLFFGIQLDHWFNQQQGAIYLCVAEVLYYLWRARRLDRQYGF